LKILVIGGRSFLGRKIVTILSRKHKVISSHHRPCKDQIVIDLEKKEDTLNKLERIKPDIVIVTAALNNIEKCESDKELAWKTNVESLVPMIEYCKKNDAKLVFLSSCAVFSGQEEHLPYKKNDLKAPVSFYGVTKVMGENIIQRDLENYLIIRSDSFYGYNDDNDRPTFPIEVIKTLKEDKEFNADNIRKIYPTLINDLARLIIRLIDEDRNGIYQVSSSKEYTHFTFALEIAEVFGLDKGLIKEKEKSYFLRPMDGKMSLDVISFVKTGLWEMKENMEEGDSKYLSK